MKSNGLTSKEILLAYINTLSETRCKQAYVILQEEFNHRRIKYLKFNKDGIEDKQGTVRLRKQDYTKIVTEYGQEYFLKACEKMANYIKYLEDNQESNPKYSRTLRDLRTRNHYKDIVQGWIRRDLERDYPRLLKQKDTIDFFEIDSVDKAKIYINNIPEELRYNNYEIEYLVNKYPQLLEEVIKNDR